MNKNRNQESGVRSQWVAAMVLLAVVGAIWLTPRQMSGQGVNAGGVIIGPGGSGGGTTLAQVTNVVNALANSTDTNLFKVLGWAARGAQTLFNPYVENGSSGSTKMRQSGEGLVLDSGANNGTSWIVFGSNMSLVHMECVVKGVTNYYSPGDASGPHIGPVAQWANSDNTFRGFLGLDTLRNVLHYADRDPAVNSGNEVGQDLVLTNWTMKMGDYYKVIMDITNSGVNANTNCMMSFIDVATGIVITNKNFQMGAPGTNGYQAYHTYGEMGVIKSNAVLSADLSVLVCGGPQQWASFGGNKTTPADVIDAKGNLITTNGGTWEIDLSAFAFKEGMLQGNMTISNASGIGGVAIRSASDGTCYAFWANLNNGNLNFAEFDNTQTPGPFTSQNFTLALGAGTNYPWTLESRGSQMTFRVGGNALTVNNTDYDGSGYVGFLTRITSMNWGTNILYYTGVGDGNGKSIYAQNTNGLIYGNFPQIVMTNFISGGLYTNLSGAGISVHSGATWTNAAIAGEAEIELQIGNPGGTLVGISFAGDQTISSTLATTNRGNLDGFVTNGGVYTFTNKSTGAGNGAGLVPGTGQLITF